MNLDLVIVGNPLPEMKPTIPLMANVYIEEFGNGYNEALNRGAKKGKSDYIGFCNNDIVFTDDSIPYLIDALQYFDSVSPWCPKTHHQWWGNSKPLGYQKGYDTGKIVAGWCIFMKRSTWDTIGGFDERLSFWCCDNSYCKQIEKSNLTHALVPMASVVHLQSVTLNQVDKKRYDELTKQQVRIYNKLYNENLFGLGT